MGLTSLEFRFSAQSWAAEEGGGREGKKGTQERKKPRGKLGRKRRRSCEKMFQDTRRRIISFQRFLIFHSFGYKKTAERFVNGERVLLYMSLRGSTANDWSGYVGEFLRAFPPVSVGLTSSENETQKKTSFTPAETPRMGKNSKRKLPLKIEHSAWNNFKKYPINLTPNFQVKLQVPLQCLE